MNWLVGPAAGTRTPSDDPRVSGKAHVQRYLSVILVVLLIWSVLPAGADTFRPVSVQPPWRTPAHLKLEAHQTRSAIMPGMVGAIDEALAAIPEREPRALGAKHPPGPKSGGDGDDFDFSTRAERDGSGVRRTPGTLDEWVDDGVPWWTFAIVVVIGAFFLYRHLKLVRLNRRLVVARDAAEVARQAKGRFLAHGGRELRTPLNAVVNLARLALKSGDAERVRGYLQDIESSARSLRGTVNEALDFSGIAGTRMALTSTSFELRKVLDKVLAVARPPAQVRRLDLICELSSDVPDIVIGDPGKLGQVLVNLVGSAMQLTVNGGVELAVARDTVATRSGRLRFLVKGIGAGRADEHLDGILSPYGQGHAATAGRQGGTDLGIAIAEGLVEVMGGRIEVHARPGEGSELGFSIPLPSVPSDAWCPVSDPCVHAAEVDFVVAADDTGGAEAVARMLKACCLSWRVRVIPSDSALPHRLKEVPHGPGEALKTLILDSNLLDEAVFSAFEGWQQEQRGGCALIALLPSGQKPVGEQYLANGLIHAYVEQPCTPSRLYDAVLDACEQSRADVRASGQTPPVVPDGDYGSVLVIEPDGFNLRIVDERLKRLGIGCDLTVNGQGALDLLRARPDHYGLVLMDVPTPVMDGCEGARLIRSEQAPAGLSIVAMMADATEDDRVMCLACGMDDCLSKPIEQDVFDRMIRRWLRRSLGRHASRRHGVQRAPGNRPAAGYPDQVPRGSQLDTRAVDRAAGIRWADGDADLYRKLVNEFRRSYKEKVGLLTSETAPEHLEEVAYLAHALKSSAAVIGAARLAHAAAELDGDIRRNGRLEADRVAEVKESLAAVIRELGDQVSAAAGIATGHDCGPLPQDDGRAAILVVDDEPSNLLLIREFLSPEHRVYCAQGGARALELADGEPGPDLILLDVMMPEMDGFEACRRLKLNPSTREIPVVFITGKTDVVDEQKGLALGAIDYIPKPFNRAVLQARVRNHVALKRQGDFLERLSGMDALTGIANRRRLDEVLEREWNRAIRDHSTVALLMIDVDYFKAFNDRYGHDGGDECLRLLGKTMDRLCRRSTDLVARYGGEELAWVMPETDLEGAAEIARELLEAIRDLDIPHAGSAVSDRVTASIGVWASAPEPGDAVKDFVKRADERLYQAKRDGRNRIVS